MPITCNLVLNPSQFQVRYVVNGETSPTFQVFPKITTLSPYNPSPFNSEQVPFLIPAAAEIFGFNVQALSGQGSAPVYWRVTLRYFHLNGTPIVSPGDPANNFGPFDFVSAGVSELLQQGQSSVLAGFTAFDPKNPWLFKADDLPLNIPVRLEITVSGSSDPNFGSLIDVPDDDPSNNAFSFWMMRCSLVA